MARQLIIVYTASDASTACTLTCSKANAVYEAETEREP